MYITEVAEDEEDEARARKFPFVANELLNSDAEVILDCVIGDEGLM